ncbi:DinB family protein [Fredinandcohnia quinoae]|uniref:DinB family protein n=1 Tax=Fredinandcohnia quinoae TaxID=2918902 RepID=A0AAW5E380_9BACI|nr:DinB family protein [Fredinandcohnia sp. SECRCQ15]MCH1624352.1 DinB family protein [Fredinandcohnia sp. SECRCQ15]
MDKNNKIREELLDSVKELSDEQLNKKVEDGSWTIMQVLEHLFLMERTVAYTISEQLKNNECKPTSEKPIHLTVYRSTKVTAPSFVTPSGEYTALEEMKTKLAESRKLMQQVVDIADEVLLSQKSYPHPVFGSLSLKQWIPFVGLHEKRHIEQIEEIKGKLS